MTTTARSTHAPVAPTPLWRRLAGNAWLEAAVLAIVAVLLFSTRPAPPAALGTFGQALFAGDLPAQLVVGDPPRYRLDLAGAAPLVRDVIGAAQGRLDRDQLRELRDCLRHAAILRELPAAQVDDNLRRRLGLDPGVLVTLGDQRLRFGSTGSDRGYLATPAGSVLVLSTDPAALLQRPAESWRDTRLGLPDRLQRIGAADGWQLFIAGGRWWLRRDGSEGPAEPSAGRPPGAWVDQERVVAWLGQLINAPVLGFDAPPKELPRAKLVAIGKGLDGDAVQVGLIDLGPAADGRGRQLRLHRAHPGAAGGALHEDLVLDLDATLLDPAADFFLPRTLLPMDPRRADHLRFGSIELTREGDDWLLAGSNDADQAQIDQLLEQLAALPRLVDPPAADGSQSISLAISDWRWSCPYTDPRLADLLARLRPHHLRQRDLLPGVTRQSIVSIVFSPRDGAPQFFTRQPGQPWPEEDGAALAAFIDTLLEAAVARWTGSTAADAPAPFTPDSSITIATVDGHHTIRLQTDGQVHLPERGLVGELDRASRRRLMEQ